MTHSIVGAGIVLACAACAGGERPGTGLPVDSGYVVTDDSVRLFYRSVGDGPLDVVIPVALYLDPVLRPLASPERRLVFYDLRARGQSEAGDRSRITLDRQLSDLETLRTALGIDSMMIIGWSGLGMEMFVYALRHPARVVGLVQVAPVAARDEPHNARAYEARIERMDTVALRVLAERQEQGAFAEDPAAYCRAVNGLSNPTNFADTAMAGRAPDTCRHPNEYPDSLGLVFTSLLGSFAGYDWREAAARLPVRRLVIHGVADAFPVDGSREWVPEGANARLMVLEGAGHFPFIERPDAFFSAVDAFLNGDWPAAVR